MPLPLEQKRNEVLLAAYELHQESIHIQIEELEKRVSVSGPEFYNILRYFGSTGKGWLNKYGMVVRFSSEGLDNAEKLLSSRMAQKERRVLETIYDLGGATHMEMVQIDVLQQEVGMTFSEINPILIELEEEKQWIGAIEHAVWLLPAGVREVERRESRSDTPLPHIIINNPQNSPMSFGPNSSQTVSYNNQNVQDILPDLSRLIQDVHQLEFETRGDVIGELQKVETLAKGDVNAGTWQLIQSRLVTTKTALEIGKIAIDSLPYWPAVWNFFFK